MGGNRDRDSLLRQARHFHRGSRLFGGGGGPDLSRGLRAPREGAARDTALAAFSAREGGRVGVVCFSFLREKRDPQAALRLRGTCVWEHVTRGGCEDGLGREGCGRVGMKFIEKTKAYRKI